MRFLKLFWKGVKSPYIAVGKSLKAVELEEAVEGIGVGIGAFFFIVFASSLLSWFFFWLVPTILGK